MSTCRSVQAVPHDVRVFSFERMLNKKDIIELSFFFQLPDFLSQVKEALGLLAASAVPSAPLVAPAVAGLSRAPPLPVPVISSTAPAIVLENSDSESDVQTLAVPFRSGSSEAYLPMVSTDDSWSTDTEFRFVFIFRFTIPILFF